MIDGAFLELVTPETVEFYGSHEHIHRVGIWSYAMNLIEALRARGFEPIEVLVWRDGVLRYQASARAVRSHSRASSVNRSRSE